MTGKRFKKFLSLFIAAVIASSIFMNLVATPDYVYADGVDGTVSDVQTGLNVRSKPSTTGTIVTTLSLGTRVKVLEEVSAEAGDTSGCAKWYKITATSGNLTFTGYVASTYVKTDPNSNPANPTPTPTGTVTPTPTGTITPTPTGTVTPTPTPVAPVPTDAAFEESITAFPDSYKPYLRDLHNKHPKWAFHADYTGVSWSTVLDAETENGVSLVVSTADATWKSKSFTQVVDAPNWVNASRALVAYYLDPRNGINENGIFQFANLNYTDSSISSANIANVLKGTFMEDPKTALYNDTSTQYKYADLFAKAANDAAEGTKGLNPIFLAAHAVQECGTNGSISSNGTTGYYNFYNIGAHSDAVNATRHGIDLAQNGLDDDFNKLYAIPWNTPGLSIVNGAKWIFNNYTSKGQYTLYYMRFNTSPLRTATLCRHQYMTATTSCAAESKRMFDAYKSAGIVDIKIDFYIPVYTQMPAEASKLPTSNTAYDEFVKVMYGKLLGREPSATEISSHSTNLSSGKTAASVIADFINSSEFAALQLNDEDFIKLMYSTLTNREASSDEIKKWKDYMALGYSRNTVFTEIINSEESHTYIGHFSVDTGVYANPDVIDQNMKMRPFVVGLYKGVLGRDPSRDEVRAWISDIATGKISGPQAAAQFCLSDEMKKKDLSNEDFVSMLYKVCLGREADAAGLESWTKLLKQQYTREYVVAGFVNSSEFATLCKKYGISTTAFQAKTERALEPNETKIKAFVTRLYDLALGRKPDTDGFNAWVKVLTSGEGTGYSVAYGFIFSKEMTDMKLSDEEFLTRLYRIFLDREPDEKGFQDWLKVMKDGGSRLNIFEGFVYSTEFKDRCLEAGFKPNDQFKL